MASDHHAVFLEVTQIPTEKPEFVPAQGSSTIKSCNLLESCVVLLEYGVPHAGALAGPSREMERALPQALLVVGELLARHPLLPPVQRDACTLEASLNYRSEIIRKQILPQCSFTSIF